MARNQPHFDTMTEMAQWFFSCVLMHWADEHDTVARDLLLNNLPGRPLAPEDYGCTLDVGGKRGAWQKVQGERPQRPDPSSRREAHAPTGLRLSAGSCPQAMTSLLACWPRYLLARARRGLCLLRPGRRA